MQPQPWEIPASPLRGYVWRAETPRAAVLLTHGMGEYATRYVEQYAGLIPALVAAGYTVYAYDQRGHGQSPGRKGVYDVAEMLQDHFTVREALRSEPLPLYAFGHSLGGLMTAAGAARDPRGLSGVILSSPALLVGEDEPKLLKMAAPVLARLWPSLPTTRMPTEGLSRLKEGVSAYEADEQVYQGAVTALTAASLLGLSTQLWPDYARWRLPALIVHGDQDKLADVRGSQRFFDTIPVTDKTLHIERGGYHELLNDEPREQVRALILDWLRERMGG